MPYIPQQDRPGFDLHLDAMPNPRTKGELEYCIFKLMLMHMQNKGYTYTNLHDTVYAAAHCAHEFERRHLDPRENNAILSNGDIIIKGGK